MTANDLILLIAFSQIGEREEPGAIHNNRILQYFEDIGYKWVRDDETAWCSAFANWVAQNAHLPKSGKLNARSWLTIGNEVDDPEPGDVVVFWRESPTSWKGHVAFYISEDEENIMVLGGNQGNEVNISSYPKIRVLSFRRLG